MRRLGESTVVGNAAKTDGSDLASRLERGGASRSALIVYWKEDEREKGDGQCVCCRELLGRCLFRSRSPVRWQRNVGRVFHRGTTL